MHKKFMLWILFRSFRGSNQVRPSTVTGHRVFQDLLEQMSYSLEFQRFRNKFKSNGFGISSGGWFFRVNLGTINPKS